MNQVKREYWDSIIEAWKTTERQALWRRHSDAVNSQLLQRWLPSDRVPRLLKTDLFDEAISEGLFELLSDHAGKVVGLDLSPGIVDAARKRYPALEAHTADVRELSFDDASFDIVVSISTLDHFDSLQDIRQALDELSRVLRPGGQLLLTLDNLSHPAVWLRSILPQRLMLGLGLIPYRVGATCRPRRLQAFCRSSGLVVSSTSAILHCPRALAVAGAAWLRSHASEQTQERYLRGLMSSSGWNVYRYDFLPVISLQFSPASRRAGTPRSGSNRIRNPCAVKGKSFAWSFLSCRAGGQSFVQHSGRIPRTASRPMETPFIFTTCRIASNAPCTNDS